MIFSCTIMQQLTLAPFPVAVEAIKYNLTMNGLGAFDKTVPSLADATMVRFFGACAYLKRIYTDFSRLSASSFTSLAKPVIGLMSSI